ILKSWMFRMFSEEIFKKLGVKGKDFRISPQIDFVGDYCNLILSKNAEINKGCFLLAKAKIYIGENSTIAYQASLVTSANPNGPKNRLCRLYPSIKKSIHIGDNTWIGARAVILPGVKIGDFCVVAA